VGGLVGSLAIGLFADPAYFGGDFLAGAFYGGGFELLGAQAIGNAATIAYCFVVTTLIMLALKSTIGVRVSEEVEETGLDHAEHAETAYSSGSASLAGH
jgi:Amt family ammonium transporter